MRQFDDGINLFVLPNACGACDIRIGPLLQFEPCRGKERVIRDFIRSGDIAAEKILKAFSGDLFDGRSNVIALVIKLSLPWVLRVQAPQHVVERLVIVGGVADGKIEENASNLALVVVGNAAVGLVVVVVFFEPGVETGFLHALPRARGTELKCVICEPRSA